MANFHLALPILFNDEGVFSDKPTDKGGPTKYGITMKTLANYRQSVVTPDSIKNLEPSEAADIYKQNYWDLMKLDQINDQVLATVMLDLGVLHGPQNIVKVLQRLLLDSGEDDGVVGVRTLEYVNQAQTFKGMPVKNLSLWVLADITEDFFEIVRKDPSQGAFLAGWLNRVNRLVKLAVSGV